MLDPIDSGVRFSPAFEQYEAAIAAGATLDELYRWDSSFYPPWFMANVIAWYRGHLLVKVSGEDAVARKMKADAKKRGKK